MATLNDFEIKLKNMASVDLEKALTKAALLVEADAKRKCPVDTGYLRNSITHEVDGNTATIGTNVSYAPFVHWGTGLYSYFGNGRQDVPWHYKDEYGRWHTTSGIHPTPFLTTALEENRNAILDIFKESLDG